MFTFKYAGVIVTALVFLLMLGEWSVLGNLGTGNDLAPLIYLIPTMGAYLYFLIKKTA